MKDYNADGEKKKNNPKKIDEYSLQEEENTRV